MGVVWTEAMRTGVAEIDDQHKEFLRRMNDLLEAIAAGAGAARVGPLFDYLGEYVALHFGTEEACMLARHCPAAAQNESAHRKFIDTFERLRARHRTGGTDPLLLVEVQRDLADWFVNHICRVDVVLRDTIADV